MIKSFRGGRDGGWGGGSSERCLKWGGGGGGLKVEGQKLFVGGLKVSPPLPSRENFNYTLSKFKTRSLLLGYPV